MSSKFKKSIRANENKKLPPLEFVPTEDLEDKTYFFPKVKLLSKNYDKFFFKINKEQFNELKSAFKGEYPKCIKEDGDKYSLSAFPLMKEEYTQSDVYHLYTIRCCFEKSKNGSYYLVATLLEDRGVDPEFSKNVEERNNKLSKKLRNDE